MGCVCGLCVRETGALCVCVDGAINCVESVCVESCFGSEGGGG